MSKAYRIVFECPKGGHDINFQRKCSVVSQRPALWLAREGIQNKAPANLAFLLGSVAGDLNPETPAVGCENNHLPGMSISSSSLS
jgi:hypothetical protein